MTLGSFKIKVGEQRERMLLVTDLAFAVKLTEAEKISLKRFLDHPVKNAVWTWGNITIRCVEVFE